MIPLDAKIQQIQFVVMKSSIDIHVTEKTKRIDTSKIPLDIDFEILQRNDNPYFVRVVMTIKGNHDKSVAGYVFEVKVGGEYKISEEVVLDDDEFKAYVQNSAVACLINETRLYLQTLTSFHPFRSYIMPMIDMKNLWEQKTKISNEKQEKQKIPKKRSKTSNKSRTKTKISKK